MMSETDSRRDDTQVRHSMQARALDTLDTVNTPTSELNAQHGPCMYLCQRFRRPSPVSGMTRAGVVR